MAWRTVASVAFVLACLCARGRAQTPAAAAQPPHAALPTIQVTAGLAKRRAARAKPAAMVRAASPTSSPPQPYVTGARNVAGGAAIVPTQASQMTVAGQDLNARPLTPAR